MANFMKKGAAAQKMHAQAEAEAEARKKQSENKAYRFWLPQDTEAQITFLDGELDSEGILSAVTFWEHNLKINGKWGNTFACTQLEEKCPICEGGDNPYLVTLFTVIDHREYKDKNGKTHKNNKRIFACKRETYRRLQKIAVKRGGLAGITFDVSRSGEKSASVGDTFDYVEKSTPAELMKAYGLDAEAVKPFDYEEVVPYFTAKELRQQGFGELHGGADTSKSDTPTSSKGKGSKAIGAGDSDDLSGGSGDGYEDEV